MRLTLISLQVDTESNRVFVPSLQDVRGCRASVTVHTNIVDKVLYLLYLVHTDR